MRSTSRQSYQAVKATGLVTGLRWQVYRVLHHNGPLTANEVAQFDTLNTHQIDSVRPRFAELESLGVIESVGSRECSVTNMNSLVWNVTDYVPTRADLKPKARTFWIVKPPNRSGRLYEDETSAKLCLVPGYELIEVREIIRKHK